MNNLFFPPTGSQLFGRPLRKHEISLSFKITFIFTRKRGSFVLLSKLWWQLRALLNSFGIQSHFSLKIEKASEICISLDYSAVEPGQFVQEIFELFSFWKWNKHKCSSPKRRGRCLSDEPITACPALYKALRVSSPTTRDSLAYLLNGMFCFSLLLCPRRCLPLSRPGSGFHGQTSSEEAGKETCWLDGCKSEDSKGISVQVDYWGT